MAATNPAAGPTQRHKPTKGFYDNEPKNVLFFVFFACPVKPHFYFTGVASCDQMRRIIQSYK